MKKDPFVLFLLISLFAWSCTIPDKNTGHTKIINLPESLHHIEMMPLSKIATDIEYLPLADTPNEALVGNILSIHYDNDLIFIKDNTGLIKIFDRQGAFVRSIDRIGRGPQEHSLMSNLSISSLNGNLLLADFSTIKEYNRSGTFIREVEAPQIEGYRITKPLMIAENLFIASISNVIYDREYCAVIYDSLANILQMIPTPELYLAKEQQQPLDLGAGEGGERIVQFVVIIESQMCRFEDQVRFFYPETTEIFTTTGHGSIDTAYVIDYGKYRMPGGDYAQDGKYLCLNRFVESKSHLFMNVIIRNVLDDDVVFIGNILFDKHTLESHFLHDRSKKMNGFIDDIQGGPAFWPRTLCGENLLVSYIYPIDLLEHTKQNKVSEQLTNTLSSLTDDSNPVVVLVHLK